MIRQFTIYWLDKTLIAKGWGDSCQKCAELIKDGHNPKIVVEYVREENE